MSVPGVGPRFEMAIPTAFVSNVAVSELSIDHPTTRLETVSFGNGAADPAFTCGMFADIRDRQLVRLVAGEFAVYEIAGGRSLMLGTRTLVPGSLFTPAALINSSMQPSPTAIPWSRVSSARTRRAP